eukprot:gene9227-11305_t
MKTVNSFDNLNSSSSSTIPLSYSNSSINGVVTTSSSNYSPLCFSKEVFLSESFQIDTFIQDCRKRVNLESVQKDLREYSKHLDSELIELINKEYHSFFSLSSSLVGIDLVLNDFNLTQSSIKSEILSFKSEINKVRDCVEDKLKEKKQIDKSKKLLQLYITVSETCNNTNKLFDQLFILSDFDKNKKLQQQQQQQLNNNNSSNTLTLELVIERISNSYYSIQNQFSSLSQEELNLNIFQSLKIKIKELANKIEEKLEPIFKQCLIRSIRIGGAEQSDNINVLSNCLKTYQVLNRLDVPYRIFRDSVLRSKFTAIINIKNLEGSTKSSTEGLSTIYSMLIEFLRNECSNSIISPNEELSFNFLSESVLPVIDEIVASFKQIFATGIPDLFYKNYNLTLQFVQQLEELCLSPNQVYQFRLSNHYQSLWKKWNFPVYFQLRFSEIASKFEFQFLQTPLFDQMTIPITNDPDLKIATSGLFSSLEQYSISSFELVLQQQLQQQQQQQLQQQDNTDSTSTPTTINPYQKSTLTNKQTSPENLVFLFSDILKIRHKISNHFKSLILNTIGHNHSNETINLIQNGIEESDKQFSNLLPRISNIITHQLITKCSESLMFIKTITSTYRLTNRPVPTNPSTYVSNIVNPLESFLNNKAYTIPTQFKIDWATTVLKPVTEEFKTNAISVLESVNKLNDAINKMFTKKKGNISTTATTTGNTQEVTDIDKISIQLYLDVKKYGSLIEKNGVNINEFPAYIDLLNLVEPFKKAFPPHAIKAILEIADNLRDSNTFQPVNDPIAALTTKTNLNENKNTFNKYSQFSYLLSQPVINIDSLRALSWRGVPVEHRPLNYLPLEKRNHSKILYDKRNQYQQLVNKFYHCEMSPDDKSLLNQVKLDVPRTIPRGFNSTPLFRSTILHKVLERILYCWSKTNPLISYFQGLNDIPAQFLLVFLTEYTNNLYGNLNDITNEILDKVEADTFWCLSLLMNNLKNRFIDFHDGIKGMSIKLEKLVKLKEEKLSQHLVDEQCDFILFSLRWMICLLSRELEFPLSARLWDSYIAHGPNFGHFHIYICAALITTTEWIPELMKSDFSDVIVFLQHLPTEDWNIYHSQSQSQSIQNQKENENINYNNNTKLIPMECLDITQLTSDLTDSEVVRLVTLHLML